MLRNWGMALACTTLLGCVEPLAEGPPPEVPDSAPVVVVVAGGPAAAESTTAPPAEDRGEEIEGLARRWRGIWESETGYRCSFDLVLDVDARGWIDGVFAWKLVDAPDDSTQRARIGQSGHEYVRGAFDPKTQQLDLRGYAVDAPRLLVKDHYVVAIDPTGDGFAGRSEGTAGLWLDRLTGQAVDD